MGGIYSTQNKSYFGDNGEAFFQLCDESNPQYSRFRNKSVYSTDAFSGLHNMHIGYNNELVKIPKNLKVEDFCAIGFVAAYPFFEIQETNLVTIAVILFALAIVPFPEKNFNRLFVIFRLSLIAIGLVILLRTSNPKKNVEFNDLINFVPRSLANVTNVSQQVKDGKFVVPSGNSEVKVPGTKSTENRSELMEEYLEIQPNTVLPLHTHAKPVFAVMISGDLEYTVNGKWNKWSKGAILSVLANIPHSVRAGPSGGALMTFTDDYESPLTSMKVGSAQH